MSFEMDNIRKKSKQELFKELSKKYDQIRKIRFDMANNQVKNVKEIRGLKKDIARTLTSLRERDINGK